MKRDEFNYYAAISVITHDYSIDVFADSIVGKITQIQTTIQELIKAYNIYCNDIPSSNQGNRRGY